MSLVETISLKGKPFHSCPTCGTPVRFSYRSAPHVFQTLEGKKRVFTCIYSCENGHHFFNRNPHVFPGKGYGMDVFALANYWRHEEKRTLEEVKALLEKDHGIKVGRETIRRMVLAYQIFNHEYISPVKIRQIKANGGIVLAMDALDPTKGADPLYVVRDELTDTVLAAEFIYSATEQVLTDFLSRLRDRLEAYDIPIKGIISDKHRGQEKAIENVFPGIPHQLCVYHFLRNASELGIKWDKHLATQLRKEIRRNHYVLEYKKTDS